MKPALPPAVVLRPGCARRMERPTKTDDESLNNSHQKDYIAFALSSVGLSPIQITSPFTAPLRLLSIICKRGRNREGKRLGGAAGAATTAYNKLQSSRGCTDIPIQLIRSNVENAAILLLLIKL